MRTIKTFDGKYTFTDEEFVALYSIVEENLGDYDRAGDMLADYAYDNGLDFNISAVLDRLRAFAIEKQLAEGE